MALTGSKWRKRLRLCPQFGVVSDYVGNKIKYITLVPMQISRIVRLVFKKAQAWTLALLGFKKAQAWTLALYLTNNKKRAKPTGFALFQYF
jgi:hypothetical protein